MPKFRKQLIKNGKIEPDDFELFDAQLLLGTDEMVPPDNQNWIISFETWRKNIPQLMSRKHPIAILISSDTEINDILLEKTAFNNTEYIAFIAIDFPVYTDGRGYSIAQALRNLIHWQGELRAVGDVLIDIVFYLARCGFNSFLIKDGHDPKLALSALNTFTNSYQKSYESVSN